MNNYQIVRLQDFADVKGGKRTPKGASVQDEKTDHPYIRVKDFDGHDLNKDGIGYITEEVHNKIKRYTISKKDIFISIAGTIGVIGKIPDDLDGANLTENAAKITNISDEFEKDYLLYFLRSKYGQQIIKGRTTGTSQPKLALFRIREFEIPKPQKKTQQKIASILSTFDDLIENNTRRIEILEEMARLIYREWFVHYRYPGHENDKLVDSGAVLGEIPEGWVVTEAQDIIDFNPRTSIDKEKSRPYLPMGNVSENSMVIDDTDLENRTGSSGTKFQNNDTLFARITPSLENGKTGFVQFLKENEIALGSTEFIVMRSKKVNPYYVYCLARDDKFRETAIKSMTGASGRQRVRVNTIKDFSLPLPADNLLNEFQEIAKPMFEQVHTLTIQNKKLKTTRDLLLPKLISKGIFYGE